MDYKLMYSTWSIQEYDIQQLYGESGLPRAFKIYQFQLNIRIYSFQQLSAPFWPVLT